MSTVTEYELAAEEAAAPEAERAAQSRLAPKQTRAVVVHLFAVHKRNDACQVVGRWPRCTFKIKQKN